MNRLGRTAAGALVGIVATILIHPASRRFVLLPFLDLGPSVQMDRTEWLPSNLGVLPSPQDTLQASLWMQVGAEMITQRKPIEPEDLNRLIAVAEASSQGEPENAFWLQMKSVFLWESGRREEARQAWIHASLALSWNDYQSRRFEHLRSELEAIDGGPMAWHSAAAYFRRSTAMARTIDWFCRSLFERSGLDPEEEMAIRLATVRNGRLLRDGSRSIAVGVYGAQLVEYSYAPVGASRASPRQQLLSRDSLVNAVRRLRLPAEAAQIDEAFQSNDAWLALTRPQQARANATEPAVYSVITAGAPGVLLGLSAIGFLLLGAVRLLEVFPRSHRFFRPPWTPALGVLVGVWLYLQSGLILAAVAATLCFSFVAFEPANPRKRLPNRMGFGFRLAVFGLTILFIVLLGGFWIGLTTPSLEVVTYLDYPASLLSGNQVLLSLAVLVFAMLFLAAPGWAIVDRIPTPYATVLTLREFALRLAWVSLAACIVAAPIAVYVDNQVRTHMGVLMANEPAHYLLQ